VTYTEFRALYAPLPPDRGGEEGGQMLDRRQPIRGSGRRRERYTQGLVNPPGVIVCLEQAKRAVWLSTFLEKAVAGEQAGGRADALRRRSRRVPGRGRRWWPSPGTQGAPRSK
jgi:hypothetical protein